MALAQRRPKDVIHHSDQGSQYTSIAFGQRCTADGVRPLMGSAGDCFDNALCESFFATLECELIERYTFRSYAQARIALFRFIEGWYNPHRRHSALDYMSPINYERRWYQRPEISSPNLSTKTGYSTETTVTGVVRTHGPGVGLISSQGQATAFWQSTNTDMAIASSPARPTRWDHMSDEIGLANTQWTCGGRLITSPRAPR